MSIKPNKYATFYVLTWNDSSSKRINWIEQWHVTVLRLSAYSLPFLTRPPPLVSATDADSKLKPKSATCILFRRAYP